MRELVYRSVTEYDDLKMLIDLQQTAWPQEMWTSDVHMRAAVLHGGSVVAVYDGVRPIGFCYGFPAFDGRQAYLHSHMMVIDPAYRDHGLGMRLKLEQRRWAISHGYDAITWTFDPCQLRNGYLNLCKLAGTVAVYVPALYGVDAAGVPTDRFLVRWELHSADVEAAVRGQRRMKDEWKQYPIWPDGMDRVGQGLIGQNSIGQNSAVQSSMSDEETMRSGRDNGQERGYLIAVTKDMETVKRQNPADAKLLKQRLREQYEQAFRLDYRVVGLLPAEDDVAYYVLEKRNNGASED